MKVNFCAETLDKITDVKPECLEFEPDSWSLTSIKNQIAEV